MIERKKKRTVGVKGGLLKERYVEEGKLIGARRRQQRRDVLAPRRATEGTKISAEKKSAAERRTKAKDRG